LIGLTAAAGMREEGSVVQLEAIDGHREWKRIGTE